MSIFNISGNNFFGGAENSKYNFSGCTFHGCAISGIGGFGNSQKFDENKSMKAAGIKRITVITDSASVIVTAGNTDSIEAHFYGEVVTNSQPNLSISRDGQEATVNLSIDSSIMSSGMTLEVNIPVLSIDEMFEALNVNSYNGDIEVRKGVSAKQILLETHNGTVESNGDFAKINAVTHNGAINICIDAKRTIEVLAKSNNGDVTVELRNIKESHVYASSMHGTERNCFQSSKHGYTAYGQVITHNGNATVK